MKTNSNDSVHPSIVDGGITIRQYYAGVAMQGMLLNGGITESGLRIFEPIHLAKLAVDQADALITALNGKEVQE